MESRGSVCVRAEMLRVLDRAAETEVGDVASDARNVATFVREQM